MKAFEARGWVTRRKSRLASGSDVAVFEPNEIGCLPSVKLAGGPAFQRKVAGSPGSLVGVYRLEAGDDWELLRERIVEDILFSVGQA